MKGRTYKRCSCTDPNAGKALGASCPQLRRRDGAWSAEHGVWHFQVELPRRADGKRRPLRRGGYRHRRDAQDAIDKISALVGVAEPNDMPARQAIGDLILEAFRHGNPLPSPDALRQQLRTGHDLTAIPTVAEWLERWLASRKRIRKTTVRNYRMHSDLWLKPQLGHHRLDELNVDHVTAMFDAMSERNDEIAAARASRDPERWATVRGMRVIGPATMHRYRATLRAAINAAIRTKLITFNAASYVELPSGKRPKALLWTDERVRHWRSSGEQASRVMLWTPEQTGAFLDHAADDPLYPLFHLIAFRGLRRGEACGLPWSETDLDAQTITITTQIVQVGWAAEFGEPKSDASGRVVYLDDTTTDELRRHKQHQAENRRTHGKEWNERGLVFTDHAGHPFHPAKVTERFQELVREANLPPIRLHDLRHGAATLTLATGADLKVVQELLGHSSITITADTYAHVLPDLAKETAQAAAAIVPRKRTATPTGRGAVARTPSRTK